MVHPGPLARPPRLRGPPLVAGQLAQLRGVLGLGHGMVVEALGLEEDGDVGDVSPEVGDRVAAVAAAGLGLQHAGAAGGGARLAELLPPRLVADGGADGHLQHSQLDVVSVNEISRRISQYSENYH